MEQPVLADKNQFPTKKVIYSHLGKTKALWILLFEHIRHDHPDLTAQWRYYQDGKSWLLRVSRKSKTIFWLSISDGSFRTTFYFTEKAERIIMKSSISDELKKQYKRGKRLGRIRGLTIVHRKKRDVEYAKQLIAIKNGMK